MAWFTAPSGATCVAAYDAIGAASLADSYVNEANPGTYDAAPGVAPSWAAGIGWTFNGSTQYLTTGLTPDVSAQSWSMLVRFASVTGSGNRVPAGMVTSGGGNDRAMYVQIKSSPNAMQAALGGTGTLVNYAPALAGGVYGMAGRTVYRNGSAESSLLTATPGVGSATALFIGALSINGTAGQFLPGQVAAIAIYSGTLTADDVTAITAAMNALPTAAAAVSSIIQAHGLYLGASLGGA